jgi:hypothetical protein
MRKYFSILMLCFLTGCATSDTKTIDLKAFSITVPKGWDYNPIKAVDSFAGHINGINTALTFDFSKHGFADNLIQSEQGYLRRGTWLRECYFCKPGITYISGGDLNSARADKMKRQGITDTTLVKVAFDPTRETKKAFRKPTEAEQSRYPKADYIADLTYKGIKKSVSVEIPAEIKAHNIIIDSTGKYIVKTVWPKVPGKGLTGVYMQSKKTSLNLMMAGRNLSIDQQKLALKAFKTITIKVEGSSEPLSFLNPFL